MDDLSYTCRRSSTDDSESKSTSHLSSIDMIAAKQNKWLLLQTVSLLL